VKGRTLIISVALHIAATVIALQVAEKRHARRATSVAVVDERRKKEAPKKKEEPPRPPPVAAPKPQAAPKAVVAAPVKEAAREQARESAAPPAPVDTGLSLGNSDGPGIDVGGPARPAQPAQEKSQEKIKTAPLVKKEKIIIPKDSPEADTCTEAPSKPVPVRSSEIGYTTEARASGVEGRLVLRITVAADGSVEKVDVVKSVDAALDAAAIAIVKGWTFKPAMRCGKPMGGAVYNFAQTFELGD
jgi:protein TonB